MASWQEVRITINRAAAEGAYAVLARWGIDSFQVEDSELLGEASRLGWGDYFPEVESSATITIVCYLARRLCGAKLARLKKDLTALDAHGFDPGPMEITEREIEEEAWAEAWKAHYHPLQIGQVWIEPSWESAPRQGSNAAVVVRLDPGMAFGSGTHPTTALCLELLQSLNLEDRLVWDVGTGSGILAIAAAKLGARVSAVDLDPLAVDIARQNQQLNNVDFPVVRGSLESLRGRPDIIVANIVADVIIPLLPAIQAVLAPRGFFIAGGIIDKRDPEALTEARRASLRLLRREKRQEWVSYLWQRGDQAG